MFNTNCGASVPLVANLDGNNGNGMFGNDSWIGLIIILALLSGGFGNNGFGFGGFGNRGGIVEPCATQADVRAAVDQQTLISKIDQQTYGLSSTFTALNDNLNSNFRGIDNAICTLGYQNAQGFSNLASQMASCCCGIERGLDGINYNLATQACDIKHAICDSTRSILDFLTTDKIATLQAENQNLKLQASQSAQNAYLLSELKPCPIPAYLTCSPYAPYNYNGCGCA